MCGDREFTVEEFDTKLEDLGTPGGEEVLMEYIMVEETEQLSKEDQHVKDCENRLIVNQEKSNQPTFEDIVSELNKDRPRAPSPMVEEIIVALKRSDSPFHHSKFPHDVNSNQYIDIIAFSKLHMPLAYHHCLLFKPPCTQFVTRDLLVIAQELANMAHMVESRSSSLHKLNTLLLKSGGLSNTALDSMQRVGHCQTAASWRAIRDKLACLADGVVKKISRYGLPLIMFDNMDMVLRYVLQHFTLPVLVFRGKASELADLSSSDAKTLDERVDLYDAQTFMLTSEPNQEYLEAFKLAMYTALSDLCTTKLRGWQWITQHFPTHHRHEASEQSKEQTSAHVEKPLFIPETQTLTMVEILAVLQDRWLELLEEVVVDKPKFVETLRIIRDVLSTEEERAEAEEHVKMINTEAGGLIISGDQLTIARIESAIRAQKTSITCLERLELITCTTAGMFHVDMSFVIYSYLQCMEQDKNLTDVLTMAFFKLKLKKNWISNCSDTIKACGNFEEHRQFLEGIGSEFLLEAIKTTLKKMIREGEEVERSREGVVSFFDRVLEENFIQTYYDPHSKPIPEQWDDLNR